MKRIISVVLSVVFFFCLIPLGEINAANEDHIRANTAFAYKMMQKYCDPEISNEKVYGLSDKQYAELRTVAKNAIKNCKTDYEKIEQLACFVANEIYYDYEYYYGNTIYVVTDAYGVYNCKKSVCAGYAKLFLALCNTVNIPCMNLYGTNHAYNAAYDKANKRWIVLDTTWMSGNRYIDKEFKKGVIFDYYFDISPERLCDMDNHEMYLRFKFPYKNVFYGISDDKTLFVAGVSDSKIAGRYKIAGSVEGRRVTGFSEQTMWYSNKLNPFLDVRAYEWYTEAVVWCYGRGYVSGIDSVTFNPDGSLTRAMFVQMLAKMSGANLSQYRYSGKFKDVEKNKWYTQAIEWAIVKGITKGTGPNTFSPDDLVTREQLAAFFMNYAKFLKYDTSASYCLKKYSDRKQVSPWAQNAVNWAVENNVISGTSATTLSPAGTATRAQAAMMFMNFDLILHQSNALKR